MLIYNIPPDRDDPRFILQLLMLCLLAKTPLGYKARELDRGGIGRERVSPDKPGFTFGANIRQIDKENDPDQVQVTQTKPSKIEMLLQAL